MKISEEFCGQGNGYSRSITLRNRLIPVGKTEENLKNVKMLDGDFERLRDDLNAPLEYDKSKNMYHYTDPTFSVPNVILTEGELFTVSALLPLMEQYKNTPLESSFKNIMKKLVDFLPDTVSVNSSFLNQDISFISDPLCFGARMAQRPDY